MKINDVSFVLPSRNNIKYFKWSYNSIRKNIGDDIKICAADDSSNDGTSQLFFDISKKDKNFTYIINNSGKRLGHTILYNMITEKLVKTPIAIIAHADMFWFENSIKNMLKYMDKKTIVSATRIEPPQLHPAGQEKIQFDFGLEPENFKEHETTQLVKEYEEKYKNITTEGIFAPWMFNVDEFISMGGHDNLFAPQSKEDDDYWFRAIINGTKIIQVRDSFVAHLTCRGSRFQPQLTNVGINSTEWEIQNRKSERNFFRKWNSLIRHDNYHKPIINNVYNIGLVIHNCSYELLYLLEVWCNNIYVDCDDKIINDYILNEQPNTFYNLKNRIKKITDVKENDIIIEFDAKKLTQQSIQYIYRISEMLADSGEIGRMGFEFFDIYIKSLETYQKNLIYCDGSTVR